MKKSIANLKVQVLTWVINSGPVIYNVIRMVASFIDGVKIKKAAKKGTPFVLIYQQGRVASTSVYESIKSLRLPYPLYHVHTLSARAAEKKIEQLKQKGGKIYRYLFVGKQLDHALKNKDLTSQTAPWKIISIFRDPIEIVLSIHFLNIENNIHEFLNESGQVDKNKALKYYENLFTHDDPAGWSVCNWFDEVFLDETGVDVFSSPFDCEKGYTVINTQKFDILLIKFEDIKKAYKYGAAELFDLHPTELKLQHANLHRNDRYSDVYKYVKENLKFTPEFCEKVYSTKLIRHFYSPNQIDELIRKWTYKSGLE